MKTSLFVKSLYRIQNIREIEEERHRKNRGNYIETIQERCYPDRKQEITKWYFPPCFVETTCISNCETIKGQQLLANSIKTCLSSQS